MYMFVICVLSAEKNMCEPGERSWKGQEKERESVPV